MTDPMELVGRLEAAVTAMQRRADDGWKMMPSGPNDDMVEALERCESYCDSCHGTAFSGWSGYEAMFKAAPDAILTLGVLTEAAACIREMVEQKDSDLQAAFMWAWARGAGTFLQDPEGAREWRMYQRSITDNLPPAPGAEDYV